MGGTASRATAPELLFEAPPFVRQGIDLEETFLRLGLLHEPFYDALRGAEPAAIAALEAASGMEIPAGWRAFLERAGASLGPLRIEDWRTPWDFRPEAVARATAAAPPKELADRRADGHLAVAHLGEPLLHYYDDDICLFLEVETGWLFTNDYDRGALVYDSMEALLLEWGHRVLDPRMAKPVGVGFAEHQPTAPPGRVAELHRLIAAAHAPHAESPADRLVGGLLGVYRFRDSGVILKACPAHYPTSHVARIQLEARCERRLDPERSAAAAVLREARARGLVAR